MILLILTMAEFSCILSTNNTKKSNCSMSDKSWAAIASTKPVIKTEQPQICNSKYISIPIISKKSLEFVLQQSEYPPL